MKRTLTGLLFLLALCAMAPAAGQPTSTLTPSPTEISDDPEPPPAGVISPSFGDGSADLRAEDLREGSSGGDAPVADASNTGPVGPPMQYISYPACTGNSPNTGMDAMCAGIEIGCPPGYFHIQVYTAPEGVVVGESGWTALGEPQCNAPGAPGAGPTPLPTFTLADFQSLPLPAGTSTVQPPGDHVLVGMPTIVVATEAEPTVIDTQLLTYPVQVRATPERYSWDFGDGTVVGPTRDLGAPWPALRNHHAYTQRGSFDITMTTYYSGEYSVAGGPWLPIPGEAEVQSAPVTRQAIAGRNELVAEPVP